MFNAISCLNHARDLKEAVAKLDEISPQEGNHSEEVLKATLSFTVGEEFGFDDGEELFSSYSDASSLPTRILELSIWNEIKAFTKQVIDLTFENLSKILHLDSLNFKKLVDIEKDPIQTLLGNLFVSSRTKTDMSKPAGKLFNKSAATLPSEESLCVNLF